MKHVDNSKAKAARYVYLSIKMFYMQNKQQEYHLYQVLNNNNNINSCMYKSETQILMFLFKYTLTATH